MAHPPSTLERPSEHLLRHFHAGQIRGDTIRTYLARGYSLAICCRSCPRMVEWTPSDLLERFGDRLDLKIVDLFPKLACSGDEGCGSQDVAVFPHAYDGDWTWPPRSPA